MTSEAWNELGKDLRGRGDSFTKFLHKRIMGAVNPEVPEDTVRFVNGHAGILLAYAVNADVNNQAYAMWAQRDAWLKMEPTSIPDYPDTNAERAAWQARPVRLFRESIRRKLLGAIPYEAGSRGTNTVRNLQDDMRAVAWRDIDNLITWSVEAE